MEDKIDYDGLFRRTWNFTDGVTEFWDQVGIIFPENRVVAVDAVHAEPGKNPTQTTANGFRQLSETMKDQGALLKAVAIHVRVPDDDHQDIMSDLAAQAERYGVAVLDYTIDQVGGQVKKPLVALTGLAELPNSAALNMQRSCISLNTSQIAGCLEGSIAGDIPQPQMTFLNWGDEHAVSAFNPRGNPIVIKSRSLGQKAPWYTINDDLRAAGADVCALTDYNLEDGIEPRALVVLPHFSGDRRFENMEVSLERLAEQHDVVTRMVYSDHPELLEGFYKKGPMCHIGASVIGIYKPAEDKGGKRFMPLWRGDHVYAIGADNPRLAGLDLHERILQEMHGRKAWPKSPHAKWMLQKFLTQPSFPLLGYLGQLKADGKIRGVFLANGDGSALAKFGRQLYGLTLRADAEGLYGPSAVERHMLDFGIDAGILADEKHGRDVWTYGTAAIVTSKNGKLDSMLPEGFPIRHIGRVAKSNEEQAGLYVKSGDETYRFA